MSDPPAWKTTALRIIGFLIMMVASQTVAVRLFTGAWGGLPDDPLWVGPTAAAIAMVAAVTWAIPGVAVVDAVRARRIGRVHARTTVDRFRRLERLVNTMHPTPPDTRCAHPNAVPVNSVVTGETLAALCPDCDQALPAAWLTCNHSSAHTSPVDNTSLAQHPHRKFCRTCRVTYWSPPRSLIPTIADTRPPTTAEIACPQGEKP